MRLPASAGLGHPFSHGSGMHSGHSGHAGHSGRGFDAHACSLLPLVARCRPIAVACCRLLPLVPFCGFARQQQWLQRWRWSVPGTWSRRHVPRTEGPRDPGRPSPGVGTLGGGSGCSGGRAVQLREDTRRRHDLNPKSSCHIRRSAHELDLQECLGSKVAS